ncbi:hypothetical protein [Paenibacillus alvei]|nr:hypothetical protein [Paenibacillus alvei]MCY7484285.1 hypothetical protein [Paenibacillus alvei]
MEHQVREIVREELKKEAAESFKRFVQAFQQPEGRELLKRVLGEPIFDFK